MATSDRSCHAVSYPDMQLSPSTHRLQRLHTCFETIAAFRLCPANVLSVQVLQWLHRKLDERCWAATEATTVVEATTVDAQHANVRSLCEGGDSTMEWWMAGDTVGKTAPIKVDTHATFEHACKLSGTPLTKCVPRLGLCQPGWTRPVHIQLVTSNKGGKRCHKFILVAV